MTDNKLERFSSINIVLVPKIIRGKKDDKSYELSEIRRELVAVINKNHDNQFLSCFGLLGNSIEYVPHITLAQYFLKGKKHNGSNKSQNFYRKKDALVYIENIKKGVSQLSKVQLLEPVIMYQDAKGQFCQLVPKTV